MLKLKLQQFCPLMQTANSLEKSLKLGKTEGRKRRGHQRMRRLDGITDEMDMNLGKRGETVSDREAGSTGPQRVRHDWEAEQQHDTSLLCELRGPTSKGYLNSKQHQVCVSNAILQ